MLVVVPLAITDPMITASSVAEPDTTVSETDWSSAEYVQAGSERIISAPSAVVGFTTASPTVVSWASNNLPVDTELTFATTTTLPTPLEVGRRYFVAARLNSGTFTIKDEDGRIVNVTAGSGGTHTATANIHQNFQAAIGGSNTVDSVDTGAETLQVTAHGLVANQPVIFTSTGSVPTGLTAGTTYYVRSSGLTADAFSVSASAGGTAVNLSSAGSGTITVHYGTATLGPNFNKHPLMESSYWTLVASTNKWAMFDSAVGSKTSEGASPLQVSLVPGAEFDSVAFLGLENVTGITIYHEINRATVTLDSGTDKVSHTAHGMAAGTQVRLTTTGSFPAELTNGGVYYVLAPGTNDYQLSLTAGGAAINLTGTGTGTHTAGQVVCNETLNASALVPYTTTVVSAANRASSTYKNGTLTAVLTGTGTIYCAEMIVGVGTEIGDTVDDVSSSIKNYTVITRDDFGNVTKTPRGYSKKLRCSVLIDATTVNIDTVSRFLAEHKDDDMLFIATDGIETHSILGFIADQEMTSPSEDYKVLRLSIEGLLAA